MARLVLIGPPTAGKTRVGQLVAQQLGLPCIDVDASVEAQTGRRIVDIFTQVGEAGFRQLEADAAEAALAVDGAVVALGGGAVVTPRVRELLAGVDVAWLDVSLDEAVRRAQRQTGLRPLLAGDVASQMAKLLDERRGLYAAASTWRIDTTGLTCEHVAQLVLGCLREVVVKVTTEHPYDVIVAHGALSRLAHLVGGTARVAVIASPALEHVASRVRDEAKAVGAQVFDVSVPVGEAAKTPAVLTDCWRALAQGGFTRSDLVIGVGGGATTDLAGLVAATFLRGIDWLAVSTSVLGMVDAAVGGKTGIDLPEGKNLVGAFYEPRAVLADLDTLATLPLEEVRSGLAEVVKEGFTDDPTILDLIEADPGDALNVSSDRLAELIVKAVRVKARVVADDLRERTSGDAVVGRERLNYGHTLGHAIEAHEHFTWRHGEAVAVGCVFAAEVAQRVLGLPASIVKRHRTVFSSLGLPVDYDGASLQQLWTMMSRDKKTRGAHLRMVLLENIGDVKVVPDPSQQALFDAYEAISY